MKKSINDFIVPKNFIVEPLHGKLAERFGELPKKLIVSGKETVTIASWLSHTTLKHGDWVSSCIGRRRRNCGSISVG